MAGTIYVALSGMRTRMAQLDRVAGDIANEGTPGYKGELAGTVAVNRPTFDQTLNAAIDTVSGQATVDFRQGQMEGTGRDMDLALEGKGFLAVQTPQGTRYTRNGSLAKSADGTLVTMDGMPVLGQNGPIKLPNGTVAIASDGTVSVDRAAAGKLQLVEFSDTRVLARENAGRFRAAAGTTPTPATNTTVQTGVLEQSNVSVAQRMASLLEVSRGFEALQRGISLMSTDIDGKAITELGRR